MATRDRRHTVCAWSHGDVLLERYQYAPGPAGETAKHSHDDYQFCLSLNFPGEYRYRGKRYAVPAGSLSIIQPRELHSARDPRDREIQAEYWMLYTKPATLQRMVVEISGCESGTPVFPEPVFKDERMAARFLRLHMALETERALSTLEKDARLESVLADLVLRRAAERLSQGSRWGEGRRAVRLAREHLEDDPARDVSLEELARIAGLTPYHFSRIFKDEVGIPPHAYQMNVRLDRAKSLLLGGRPIADVAQQTGFYDQSHFTRYFKRLVGVTPGRYRRDSKIFQY